MSPTQRQFERTGNRLIDITLEKVRGRHRRYCAFDKPQNTYFVSSIAAEETGEEGPFTESRPNNIGLKIKPKDRDQSLDIEISLDVYVPSFPDRREYEEMSRDFGEDRAFEPDSSFFRRVEVEYQTEVKIGSDGSGTNLVDEYERITEELNESIDEAVNEFLGDHILCIEREFEEIEVDMEDETAFGEFRDTIEGRYDEPPRWEVEFEIDGRRDELTLSLANRTEEDLSGQTDPYIFNPSIAVEGSFDSYAFSLIPEDFRYEREIWGKGQNCSVNSDVSESGEGYVETTAVPEHQSYRFEQNDEFRDATSLNRLADGERYLDALEELEEGMNSYHARWIGPLKREKQEELTDDELKQFLDAAEKFEKEIENFEDGIEVLEEVEEAERAFTLMNKAFGNQDGEMREWYPFQLVFIVSNIGSVVSREYPRVGSDRDDEAEVLWFPTGGGKTEAYLGLIVFSLLFDRIRGKDDGVTAWIRFPLRLLGKQQKDRFLTALHEADRVRQSELDDASEPFSIGYFVGSHDTPNSIHHDGRNNFWSRFQEDQSVLREKCHVVGECPQCSGEVDVEFDPEVNTVYHYCTVEECEVGRLPLYVTDHDIYRNVPSVLLGTLDKISISGANPRFTNLLGNFTDECPVHGLGYAGKCSESSTLDCDEDLVPAEKELYDPIPSLHLIDEVHLLNEELGVFAGQYETLYQELCRQISPDDDEPKIITSTATIAEYEEHMENLFLKEANRFPAEGPTLEESFYGAVDYDESERRYMGITPVNKTHIYAVLDLIKKYHQTVRDVRENGDPELEIERDDLKEILDFYELSVVYFLRKTEKDRFMRSIENQINREMELDGYDIPLITEQLTADIESTDVLDRLEDPEGEFDERPDTISATSFIGHGIDVDRFNKMFFFGFPSETFQYIQSSARVGRKYPGTVVDIFRPYNERDKHRYKYFGKSHEYLRRSVEAISVDRWSKFSLEKTFPGIYKALLLQYFRPVMHLEYGINVQSSSDLQDVITSPDDYPEFDRDEYGRLLERSFGVHERDEQYFKRRIQEKTESYWDFWVKRLGKEPYTEIKEEPMISLRDIGEQVEISPDKDEIGFYKGLVGGGD